MTAMIAAQTYTVRDAARTAPEFATALARIGRIGYRAVEIAMPGPVDAAETARIAADNGLTVCALHTSLAALQTDPETVADACRQYGDCRPVISAMPLEGRDTADGYARFADDASAAGRRLSALGLALGYHNHAFELQRFGDRSGLEIFYESSDPEAVSAELDTYWLQYGGADPVAWIRRLGARVRLLHLKDMTMAADGPIMAEVGAGNLNWPGILAAARDAGVPWWIVEQDTCQRDPFESLRISFENLQDMGVV